MLMFAGVENRATKTMTRGGRAEEEVGAQATPPGVGAVDGVTRDQVGETGPDLGDAVDGAGDAGGQSNDVGHVDHEEHRGHHEREVVGYITE